VIVQVLLMVVTRAAVSLTLFGIWTGWRRAGCAAHPAICPKPPKPR